MTEAKPGLGRAVILPSVLAAIGFGLIRLFLGTFLQDNGALNFGLGLGLVAFVTGRALGHFDRPVGRGVFLRYILTGVALGFAGFAFLNGLFLEGPGWPWTPWWVLGAGFGFGLYRSHKALVRQAREEEKTAKRWLGIFHPKDVEALVVLMTGYAILGIAIFLVFRAFSGLIPQPGKALTIGLAVYGLQGARLLLAFASEERASEGSGFVHWLKANALQNVIVLLVLVGYAVFRDTLAGSVPGGFFPLVEFGLGMAVFAFVLARLRGRMKKDGSVLATSSDARDHTRVVSELREADYDEVARPVTRFVESGLGAVEYASAIRVAARLDDASAEKLLAPLATYRDPPRLPPLEYRWGLAAGGAMTLGLAIAAFALGFVLFKAPLPVPFFLALLFVGFGVYAQQDLARAHLRPWPSAGIAAAGVGILFLDFLLFAAHVGSIADIPGFLWGIVGGIFALMAGIPALAAWRLETRIREGKLPARRLSPTLELANDLLRARKRAATLTFVAFALLLPVPYIASWAAEKTAVPDDFPAFLDDVLAVAIWVIAAFGASALVRFYGLTRSRPRLVAVEKAKRERRLAIHQELMRSIEKV